MTEQPGEPLESLSMTSSVIDALGFAVERSGGRPIGTLDILFGILSVDFTTGWESVQIEASFVTQDDLKRFSDPHPQADAHWYGAPLSASATQAIRSAARVAAEYELLPFPTGVMALGLLADPRSAASAALLAHTSIDHRRLLALIEENLLGTRLEGLDLGYEREFADQSSPDSQVAPEEVDPKPEARTAGLGMGFNLGTFLGAFAVSLLGGLPLFSALALAFVVRTVAVRARRRRSYGVLASASVLGLIVAMILAVTAISGLGEDRQAVGDLDAARAAIGEDNLVVAMKNLGSAGLLENESESITVLSSCVDWALGYKDYALYEAQVALTLGYEPEAETHYRGRDCYLDTADFDAIDFVKISRTWFVYPVPDKDDASGRQLLAIAQNTETSRLNDRITALGCLSNRYDMRALAGFDFTVGLNSAFRLGEGATPFAAIRKCLTAKPMGREYVVRTDPRNGVEEFGPVDELRRIPSPQRHTPGEDVCWAKFPLGGTCGVEG